MDCYILLIVPELGQNVKINQILQSLKQKTIFHLPNSSVQSLALNSTFIATAVVTDQSKNLCWTEISEFNIQENLSLDENNVPDFDFQSNWSHTIANDLHYTADQLPLNGTYYLDVYISSKLLKGTSPNDHICFMGSLYRLMLWHRANISILFHEEDEPSLFCDWCEILKANMSSTVIHSHTFWKGRVKFEEKLSNSISATAIDTPRWELKLDSEEIEELTFFNKLLQSQLKQELSNEFRFVFADSIEVLDECSLSLIPLHLFSNPVMKLAPIVSSDKSDYFNSFMDYLSSKPDIALICRLKYSKVNRSKRIQSVYTTVKWKKDVISGNTADIPPCLSEPSEHFTFAVTANSSSQSSLNVYILQSQNCHESLAYELRQNRYLLSSILDEPSFQKEFQKIPFVDAGVLSLCLKKIKSITREFIMQHYDNINASSSKNSKCTPTIEEISRVVNHINTEILTKLQFQSQETQKPHTMLWKHREPCDPWDWPERLYLFQQQMQADKSLNHESISSNSSAFVVSASDIRKHFTESGEPSKQENIETIQVKRNHSFSDQNMDHITTLEWPEIMNCNFHDIYYNTSGSEREMDGDKMKSTYLLYETASTCCNQQATPNRMIVHAKPSSSPPKKKRRNGNSVPSHSQILSQTLLDKQRTFTVDRRSKQFPTRSKSQKNVSDASLKRSVSFNNQDDLSERHKLKLREAVVFSLENFNISLDHPLFKPCARKLFAVCKPFVKDIVGKGNTSARLKTIAESHAKQVVDFEMQKQE